MYKGLSRGLQTRRDKGLTSRRGRSKGPKNGKPKAKTHVQLEATAADTQLASWQRYIARCQENGTIPFVPFDIRRKLNLPD